VKLDSNGCLNNYCGLTDSNCYYLPYPDCITSIPEHEDSINYLIIYPNPTTETITIATTTKNHQLQSITLYDITGKAKTLLLYKGELEGDNKITLNITHLPQGIYFCHITLTNGHTLTRKIIKQ
jgi:hypothetical protein